MGLIVPSRRDSQYLAALAAAARAELRAERELMQGHDDRRHACGVFQFNDGQERAIADAKERLSADLPDGLRAEFDRTPLLHRPMPDVS